MESINGRLLEIARNIEIVGADPVTRHGFTQVPNFILTNKELSVGTKLAYTSHGKPVSLSRDERLRHMAIFGSTGVGKAPRREIAACRCVGHRQGSPAALLS